MPSPAPFALPFVLSLSKHRFSFGKRNEERSFDKLRTNGSGRPARASPRLRASARKLFLLTPLLLLAACGSAHTGNTEAAADNGRISCAPQGTSDFKPVCTLDRIEGADGLTLVVHNTDGGFHRLRVTKDGRGVVAADGAEKALVTIVGAGEIEVAIGGDRYRLPATIEGRAPA